MTDSASAYDYHLVSVTAHDLKTPIAAVRGFIELIGLAGELTPTQVHYAERALGGLERMERLIANLLELSRLADHTTLTLSQFDLQTTVAELVMLMEGITFKRDITFDVQIDEAARYVLADAHDMTQVLQNLIGNAVKYNRDGGQVFITAQAAQPGEVRVTIRDTGIGIPPEHLERVFQRFTRLSNAERVEGTGLGLAIVAQSIDQHGGRIWVESVPDEGSSFIFTLPHK